MNYYSVREIKSAEGQPSGRFHYTVRNDGRVGAVGYCSPQQMCPVCEGKSAPWWPELISCENCDSTGWVPANPQCEGHDTPEGAREHYKAYLLDTALHLDGKMGDTWRRCRKDGCEAISNRFADFRGAWLHLFVLCDEHRTRETVSELMGLPGEAWTS